MPEWVIAILSAVLGNASALIGIYFSEKYRTSSHGKLLYERRINAAEKCIEMLFSMKKDYRDFVNWMLRRGPFITFSETEQQEYLEMVSDLDASLDAVVKQQGKLKLYVGENFGKVVEAFWGNHDEFQDRLALYTYEGKSLDRSELMEPIDEMIDDMIEGVRKTSGIHVVGHDLDDLVSDSRVEKSKWLSYIRAKEG